MKPSLTVGIVSFNRLHYLRALVDSFVACNGRDGFEFVLVDGASREPGLREYIDSLDFFVHRVVEPCSHAEAMNRIVALAGADVILMLPDDTQFILAGVPWIEGGLNLLRAQPQIGTLVFDAQRRRTLEKYFGGWRPYQKRYTDPATGLTVLSYGHQRPGIGGAGINTFTRKAVWEQLGPWRENRDLETFMDSGGGAEADMLRRYRQSGLRLERCILPIPAAADIITDPGGFPAKVRNGKRLGRYFPPPGGRFYYEILDSAEAARLQTIRPLPAFEDVVQPIGFSLPVDAKGNLIKGNPVEGQTEAAVV